MVKPGREDRQYSHRYHAGNVGDVWKHCVLVATLCELCQEPTPVCALDTHGGEGRYRLGPTGEWTEGVGTFWRRLGAPVPAAVQRFRELLAEAPGPGALYPGSPALALTLLRSNDRLLVWERDEEAFVALSGHIGQDPRATLTRGDGLAGMREFLTAAKAAAARPFILPFILIDPTFAEKSEWQTVPNAVLEAHRLAPAARIMLWYPLKSYTRPNAMILRLREAGLAASVLELITSPLELQRNRLNGSGLLVVNPPAGLMQQASAIAVALGQAMATHDERYTVRVVSWGASHQSA
jgi:23S rRNA (adenine2030-N6)-methyltransferase